MRSKIFILTGIVVIGALFMAFSPARADAVDNGIYYYKFHLYWDGTKLGPDRYFKFSYDLIAGPYTSVTGSDHGFVRSSNGTRLATFFFDLTTGKDTIAAPYFGNAATVEFFDGSGNQLLSVNVGASSVCNDNGVCESVTGENHNNCPNDCKLVPSTPVSTPQPSVIISATPTPATNQSSRTATYYFITFVLAAAVSVLIWLFRRMRRGNLPKNNSPT